MEITRENLLALINDGLKQHELSISALERHADVPKDTVRDFLRGKTQILRADKLQKILRILQPEDRLAIAAELTGAAEIVPLGVDAAKEYVDFPPGFSAGQVHAVRVKGDAMSPVFHDGWVIYYSTSNAAPIADSKVGWQVPYGSNSSNDTFAEFLGKPCVIRLNDDRLMLRTLKASANGRYTLAAYNIPDIKDASVTGVYKIVFIKTS